MVRLARQRRDIPFCWLSDAWWRAGIGRAKRNRNAFKHGLFTRGAIEQREQVQALIGQSRKLLQDIE
jgi:hypothetical protein